MIRLLYNLLFPLGLLFFLPAALAKMRRRGNYGRKFGQRFAIYDAATIARLAARRSTWIHAVSVGEVAIALKLATRLRELDPGFHCVLTTTTPTGFAIAESAASAWMEVMYHPLDWWPIIQRAFLVIRPSRLVLVEAEVWPNLTAAAAWRRIPIALVNARLSPRSERRFRKFRWVVAPTFQKLDLVCVQESRDVARWEALGVARRRIAHLGSVKFDPLDDAAPAPPAAELLARFAIDNASLILFGGSTHPGEEVILAETFLRLRGEFPALRLIIAPRHVERTREVRAALEAAGLSVRLRSENGHSENHDPFDCLLLDTTGELRNWYPLATVVFIGKSLTARGGQNPVEPIVAGRPVVCGPHMENFAALTEALLKHDAAVAVADRDSLPAAVARLLRAPEERRRLVANADRVLAPHRGATQRTAEHLLALKSQRA